MNQSGIRRLALATLVVALVLQGMQQALTIPAGYGVEDFLGWTNAGSIDEMRKQWGQSRIWVALVYLLFDTALFVPLYGSLLFALADKFFLAIQRDAHAGVVGPAPDYRKTRLYSVLVGILLCVVVFDLVENAFGMYRLKSHLGSIAAVAALVGAGALIRRKFPHWVASLQTCFKAMDKLRVAISACAVVAIALVFACCQSGKHFEVWAHHANKGMFFFDGTGFGLVAIYSLALLLLICAWFFGFCFDAVAANETGERGQAVRAAYEARSAFRLAVGQMVLRSRYVLGALIVFTGLALVMNQGRDVLYSLVTVELSKSWPVLLASTLGMWSFGFSCWLWSRSVCLIRPAGVASRGPRNDLSLEDRFARDWARFLGLLPAILFYLLCVSTLRDALWADDTCAAVMIAVFAALSIIGGAVFVWFHVGDTHAGFYNVDKFDEWLGSWLGRPTQVGLRKLLSPKEWANNAQKFRYRLLFFIDPFILPIVALGAMFLLRNFATDGAPAAIAIILFALTFWLSLLGWLSLNEEQISIPWVGALIVVMGVMAYMGVTQNHVVGQVSVEIASEWHIFAISALLILSYAWFVAFNGGESHLSILRLGFRSGLTFLGGVVLGALFLVPSWYFLWEADRQNMPPERAREIRAELGAAYSTWLKALYLSNKESNKNLPIYFVNAEGGGIRAGYWTALALYGLSRQDPEFLARTFSYSGVSGGSVGLAVDRACRQKSAGDATEHFACIDRFGEADLLTPLLSAWLYEDVLAMLLPAKCETPGCGFLSRGLWFERALLKGVPELKDSLTESRPKDQHEPYLFLNSTRVESGDRVIASDVKITTSYFPRAFDQYDLINGMAGGSSPESPEGCSTPCKKNKKTESSRFKVLTLATAAHNSARFPFVNAIGCPRRSKIDPPCRPNIDPGMDADQMLIDCG